MWYMVSTWLGVLSPPVDVAIGEIQLSTTLAEKWGQGQNMVFSRWKHHPVH